MVRITFAVPIEVTIEHDAGDGMAFINRAKLNTIHIADGFLVDILAPMSQVADKSGYVVDRLVRDVRIRVRQ